MNDDKIFEFSHGGLFSGCKKLCIVEEGGRIIARYTEFPQTGRDRTFEVSGEDLEELERALEGAGVRGWFANYWNPVLDGTQWSLTFEGRTHDGSNCYPEGFGVLSSFLADRFGMPGCEPEECFVERPGEIDPREHIALYLNRVGDGREQKRMDADELEEHMEDMRLTASEMRADIDALASADPRFQRYSEIIEDAGIEPNVQRMKELDVRDLDADAIIAMMAFIYRADRWDGYSEDFLECVSDGTFDRWLEALSEKLAREW